MLQRGNEENGRQMKRGCGKAQKTGDVLLPDSADGEETCRIESKDGGVCGNFALKVECCCSAAVLISTGEWKRVCVCNSHTFSCSCIYFLRHSFFHLRFCFYSKVILTFTSHVHLSFVLCIYYHFLAYVAFL